MSFDITKTSKDTTLQLNNVEIELSSWVRQCDFLGDGVSSVIIVSTGNMRLQANISKEQTEQLIENLHQHLANIKDNELELLAMNTKAAA